MPYKSAAQRAWFHANKPEMAKEWDRATPAGAKLPEHVGDPPQKKRGGREGAAKRSTGYRTR